MGRKRFGPGMKYETREDYRAAQRAKYNPEKAREKNARWYSANREKAREYSVQYRAANPEKTRERDARHHAAHREKRHEQHARWLAANPTYRSKYHATKRLTKLINGARCRSRKKNVPCFLTVESLQERYDRGICERTGLPFDLSPGPDRLFSPSLDRIDNSKGYSPENVQIVLWMYNGLKSTGSDEQALMIACAAMRRAREKRYPPAQPIHPATDPGTCCDPHRAGSRPGAGMVQLEFPFLHQSR